MRILALLTLVLLSGYGFSHSGGQDSQGGHTNRKTGEYHCHREPCFSNQAQVEQAHEEAVVAEAAFSSLYNREDWPHWIDADGDCQDTRAEILIATSQVPVKFKRNKGCNVSWGRWLDPYTGKTFEQASDLDIDHIVPLAHAHRSGAADWSKEKKREFANDPINLIPVDSSTNREKSDQAPNEWMPPQKTYWCEYLNRWLSVKKKYSLSSSNEESSFISQEIKGCPHSQSNNKSKEI